MAVALTPKQQRFVDEYLVDLNATQAAIRTGFSERTAYSSGQRMLKKVEVARAIGAAQKDLSERTKITQDMVLKRWWVIANAEVNDLIQYRRVCCRHCHGVGHDFQWTDVAEYQRAVIAAMPDEDDEGPPKPMPSDSGGYGFNPTIDPHAGCPKCYGQGNAEPYVPDTRKLTGGARMLYNGIKVTDRGLEVKMLDRDKALENVARHLGMFVDKTEVTGKDGQPLVPQAVRVEFVDAQDGRDQDPAPE